MVAELRAEPVRIVEFPGFKFVHLQKHELETIVRDQTPSWRSALSSVGGVYLICDEETGKLYVGSAYGEGGFWQRWTQYAENGHGGNVELKEMIRCYGPARCTSFRYSILEIADVATSEERVLAREAHWKRVLLSRQHGLNAN
ncbi:MAG: GIY-YIG nuclease family protein [Planctomycetes bacterium]|nr:GIY-YIG nuclease family protein [Planctomycetota bacterium]